MNTTTTFESQSQAQVELTSAALDKIADHINPAKGDNCFRIYVQGGGCSGFEYQFALAKNPEQDDFVKSFEGVTVLVDALSHPLVQGSTLDYVQSGFDSRFVLKNPNAKASCGCGNSFSI